MAHPPQLVQRRPPFPSAPAREHDMVRKKDFGTFRNFGAPRLDVTRENMHTCAEDYKADLQKRPSICSRCRLVRRDLREMFLILHALKPPTCAGVQALLTRGCRCTKFLSVSELVKPVRILLSSPDFLFFFADPAFFGMR